jgi:phage shock protein A
MNNAITEYLQSNPDRMWIPLQEVVDKLQLNQQGLGILLEMGTRDGDFRLSEHGQGYCLVLESKVSEMLDNRKVETIKELEADIQIAMDNGDEELLNELLDLINKYKENG